MNKWACNSGNKLLVERVNEARLTDTCRTPCVKTNEKTPPGIAAFKITPPKPQQHSDRGKVETERSMR